MRYGSIFIRRLSFFFFNDTATTEIYTLSLHDALPIFGLLALCATIGGAAALEDAKYPEDRKSTRLNSSHITISYAVFCLKKKLKARDTGYASDNHNSESLGPRQALAN